MDLSPEFILSAGTIVASVGGAFAVSRIRQDRHEKDLDIHKEEVWKEISKLREWRHDHQKDSAEKRLDIEKALGEVRGSLAVRDEQYREILRRFEGIDKKLDQLTNR